MARTRHPARGVSKPQTKHTMKSTTVTTRALIARINRKLKPDFEVLRKARGASAEADVGEYFVVDLRFNAIVDKHVDPESYGRELGVLKDFEVPA